MRGGTYLGGGEGGVVVVGWRVRGAGAGAGGAGAGAGAGTGGFDMRWWCGVRARLDWGERGREREGTRVEYSTYVHVHICRQMGVLRYLRYMHSSSLVFFFSFSFFYFVLLFLADPMQ